MAIFKRNCKLDKIIFDASTTSVSIEAVVSIVKDVYAEV